VQEGTYSNKIYYTSVSGSGAVTGWQNGTNLPETRYGASVSTVTIGSTKHLYVVGGTKDITSAPSKKIYHTTINNSGNPENAWHAYHSLPTNMSAAGNSSVIVSTTGNNRFLYVLGATPDSGGAADRVLYVSLPNDGEFNSNSWTTGSLPVGLAGMAPSSATTVSVGNRNYIYFYTGESLIYAEVNNSGGLGGWTTITLPTSTYVGRYSVSSSVIGGTGYLFLTGMDSNEASGKSGVVYFAFINSANGSLASAWNSAGYVSDNAGYADFDPPQGHTSVVLNGYLYILGGYRSSASRTNNVFSASTNNIISYAPSEPGDIGDVTGYAWGADVTGWVSFSHPGALSEFSVGFTMPTLPAAPTNFNAVPGNCSGNYGTADLTWTNPAEGTSVTKFLIERDGVQIADVPAHSPLPYNESYHDTDLAEGTYSYRVKSCNVLSECNYAVDTKTVAAACWPIPNAPTNLQVTPSGACKEFTFTWNDNSGDEAHFILENADYNNGNPTGWYSVANDISANNGPTASYVYNEPNLVGGMFEPFRLKACSGPIGTQTGCSAPSNVATGLVAGCPVIPDYNLSIDPARPSLTANLVSGQPAESSKTAVRVSPINGYSGDVTFAPTLVTIEPVSAGYNAITGATANFTPLTLTSAQYGVGSEFYLSDIPNVQSVDPAGYIITIYTNDGRSVTVGLNVTKVSSQIEEL